MLVVVVAATLPVSSNIEVREGIVFNVSSTIFSFIIVIARIRALSVGEDEVKATIVGHQSVPRDYGHL